VLGATSAFVGRKCAIRINLSLESLQELLAGRTGTSASVEGATPRDLSRDALVNVLGSYVPHRLPQLRSVFVSAFVS
jgi:hypothetical protein